MILLYTLRWIVFRSCLNKDSIAFLIFLEGLEKRFFSAAFVRLFQVRPAPRKFQASKYFSENRFNAKCKFLLAQLAYNSPRSRPVSPNEHGTKNDICSNAFRIASVPVRKETKKN
ncbi:hypothetical protein DLM78_10300 [Leptospira stimsonii]|uniref:Uncharacterized protein n=1 Tax=Leptospira stimsonii TaxID=2202203 RepID=A0A8B3CT90_9LEPT|nr:hypothetical protein DLM78_10300 [Leptospira stimsonii]